MRSLPLVLALLAGVAARPGRARADDVAPPQVRVRYTAAASCPDERAFVAQLEERTQRSATSPTAPRVLSISVRRAADGAVFVGRLVLEDGTRESAPREVRGVSCATVVTALALLGALVVDSLAAAGAPATADAPLAEPPPAPSPSPSQATRPTPSPARRRPAAAGAHPSPPPETFTVGMEASALGLGVPGAVPDAGLTLGVEDVGVPAIRLSIERAHGEVRLSDGGGAAFDWTFVRAQVCPLAVPLAARWRVRARACAAATIGTLDARAEAVALPQARARLWAAAGGGAHLAWRVVGPLAVEANVALEAPIVRETFFFEPTTPVYRPPPVVGRVGLAIVSRFP